MSIINEALKKTGQYLLENEAKNNPPVKTASSPKPFLIYILILLAGILLSKFIFGLLTQKSEKQILTPEKIQGGILAPDTQNHQVKTAQPVATPDLPADQSKPLENNPTPALNFVLNGIFYSDNDGYALINNQIVRENDSVDGAIVTRITENTVELDRDGKFISLSTRR